MCVAAARYNSVQKSVIVPQCVRRAIVNNARDKHGIQVKNVRRLRINVALQSAIIKRAAVQHNLPVLLGSVTVELTVNVGNVSNARTLENLLHIHRASVTLTVRPRSRKIAKRTAPAYNNSLVGLKRISHVVKPLVLVASV